MSANLGGGGGVGPAKLVKSQLFYLFLTLPFCLFAFLYFCIYVLFAFLPFLSFFIFCLFAFLSF